MRKDAAAWFDINKQRPDIKRLHLKVRKYNGKKIATPTKMKMRLFLLNHFSSKFSKVHNSWTVLFCQDSGIFLLHTYICIAA